jgi:hypothetical protein
MVMSMMPPLHEEMHQRASEDEQQRRHRGQMGAMPDDQINRARRDKAKQEKPLRIGETAEHLRPSCRGAARAVANALEMGGSKR